jgi:hypothetical protein
MKRNIFVGMLFSTALAVGVAAQGTATGSQADQKSSSQANQVTVTGCLKSADTAGGTAGTTGTTPPSSQTARNDAKFMLNNAKVTSGGAASGTAGTTGTAAAGTTSDTKFLLQGGNQNDLKKYLNSQVEIRGTVADKMGAGAGAGTGTGSAASSSGAQSDNAKVLRVSSVKQTSPTCASN